MLRFQDPFMVEGLWWFPETPDHQVPGTLTIDQEQGGNLKLNGMLRPIEQLMGNTQDERRTIHGFSYKGRRITLLNCFHKSGSLNFPGMGTETFHVNIAALGMYFSSDDEPLFSKSYFRFDGIEGWVGRKPYDVDFKFEERQISVTTGSSKVQAFATLPDQTLSTSANIGTKPNGDTEIAVVAETNFVSEPNEARSLNWHFNNAWKLQGLASLCSGHHLPLFALRLKGPEEQVAPDRVEPTSVDVLTSIIHPTGSRRSSDIPIFSGPELLALSPDSVERWFAQFEDLTPVLNLLSTVMADKSLFVNVRFLLAVQALEAFHRTTEPSPLMAQTDHAELQATMLKAMPQTTPKAMRDKLRTTLQFTNEPSLRQRLRAILEGIKKRYGEVPAGFPTKFIGSIVDTRNYYTHYVEELERKALDGAGMYFEARRIALLLTVLLLERIGVPASEIPSHLERQHTLWRLWQQPGAAILSRAAAFTRASSAPSSRLDRGRRRQRASCNKTSRTACWYRGLGAPSNRCGH